MFGIDIKTAKKVLSEFQTQLKQLNRIICEMENTVSKYLKQNQSNLIKEQMKSELEMLVRQRKKLLEFVSSLRQIIELYEETEEWILECEGNVIQKQGKEASWLLVQYSEETRNFIKRIKV